jgi:hypothetical protein
MCIYVLHCVAACCMSFVKLSMQRSCEHLIYARTADLESRLDCAMVPRIWLCPWHYMAAAFITGARQVSRLHLVRSPGSILRNRHCQITATEARGPTGYLRMQQVQAATALSVHAMATPVKGVVPVPAPPGMHFDLTSIGNVHASSSTRCSPPPVTSWANLLSLPLSCVYAV